MIVIIITMSLTFMKQAIEFFKKQKIKFLFLALAVSIFSVAGVAFATVFSDDVHIAGDLFVNGGDFNLGDGTATTTIKSSGGNVGIGTTDPKGKLGFANDGSAIAWGAGPFSKIYDNGDLRIYTDDNLHFDNDGGERLTILANGNVGIGAASPTRKLFVTGTGQTGTPTDAGSKAATLLLTTAGNAGPNDGGQIEFGAGFNAYTQPYFAAIKGLIQDGTTNTIGDLAFYTRNVIADTGLTERMRISATGNVGIGTGTTSPGAKLQVSGGDGAIATQGYGLILKASDGVNCFRVTVNNAGTLSTTGVTCP